MARVRTWPIEQQAPGLSRRLSALLGALSEGGGRQLALLLGLLAVLGYLILPPLFQLVIYSFSRTDRRGIPVGFTLDNYVNFLTQGDLLQLLMNTATFAVGVSIMALVFGGGLAWIVERTNAPLRFLGHATVFLSFAVPYVLYTIAWLLMLGPRGPINVLLMSTFNLAEPPINPYSMGTMILVEGFLWSPLVFLLLSSVFRSMDPALEDSAMTSGAGVGETLRRITLPMALPGIAGAMVLVLVRAFESFEVPALVGMPGRIYVLTTRIYLGANSLPPDYGGISAYAIFNIGLVLAFLAIYARLTRQSSRFQTISGKAFRPREMDLGRWRYLATGGIVAYLVLLLVVPFGLVLWASFMPFYTPPSADALKLVTLKNYQTVLRDPTFGTAIANTLIAGMGSAFGILVMATLASWLILRGGVRGRFVLDQVAALPLVLPGLVLGLAILIFYVRAPLPVYGTLWILVIAYITRYLPYGMRYCQAGIIQIHRELEEAAAVSGASFWRTFRSVVLPLLAPMIVSAWIFVFLLASKELSMAVLLSGPRVKVMSVILFDLWNNGQITEVAAFGTLWALVLTVVAGALFLVGRRYGVQIRS